MTIVRNYEREAILPYNNIVRNYKKEAILHDNNCEEV